MSSDKPPAPTSQEAQAGSAKGKQSFIRRYRLPIFLAVVAACLYASSILYFVFGKGQLA